MLLYGETSSVRSGAWPSEHSCAARPAARPVPSDWPEITTRLPSYSGAKCSHTARTSARSCSSLSICPLLLPKPR